MSIFNFNCRISEFDELFRDLVEVREAVKKELARSSDGKKGGDVIAEDEEELVTFTYLFPTSDIPSLIL